ncbi:MAG: hypothetical protein GY721_02275 [Deltaproteobacteria bacterium]|nr:hypothetical protein [Deltaproteobacteria bacterium]
MDPPEWLVQKCRQLRLKIVRGAQRTLGTMVGFDDGQIRAFVMTQATKHEPYFEFIHNKTMTQQIAYHLLRASTVPRMNYLSRTVTPARFREGGKRFDDMVMAALKLKLNLQMTEEALLQLRLPVRNAGMGLRSCVECSHTAFWSAATQAAMALHPQVREYPEGQTPQFMIAVVECHNHMNRLGAEEGRDLPATPTCLWTTPERPDNEIPERPQRHLMRIQEKRTFNALTKTEKEKARLTSCAQKHAGAWLTCYPNTPDLTLTDQVFERAFKFRLGLRADRILQTTCICGAELAVDGWGHFHTCQKIRKSTTIFRHDMLVSRLMAVANRANAPAEREPQYYKTARPDAKVYLTKAVHLLDVSVTHPSAQTYMAAAQRPYGAAKLRERSKTKKYGNLAAKEGSEFTPFVLETFGAIGKRAREFIAKLAIQAEELGEDRKDFAANIVQTLSVALQRGNAYLQMQGAVAVRSGGRYLPAPGGGTGGRGR